MGWRLAGCGTKRHTNSAQDVLDSKKIVTELLCWHCILMEAAATHEVLICDGFWRKWSLAMAHVLRRMLTSDFSSGGNTT